MMMKQTTLFQEILRRTKELLKVVLSIEPPAATVVTLVNHYSIA